jgi:hypothetical protein
VKLPHDLGAALFVGGRGKQVLDRVVDDLQGVDFFGIRIAQSWFSEHQFSAPFTNLIKSAFDIVFA